MYEEERISLKPVEELKYIDFQGEVSVGLDTLQLQKWNRLINVFFTGNETVPMESMVERDHQDACWWVHCGKRVLVTMRCYEDGSFAILPKPTTRRSTKLRR